MEKIKNNVENRPISILFVASEADPFIKTGGLADVIGSLPSALCKEGAQVSVVLPKYSLIPQKYKDKMRFIASVEVPLCWRNVYCGIFELKLSGVTFYFIDNEQYFDRSSPYGHFDDGERMAFFGKAVLQALPLMGERLPDIIHCHDWHSAILPVLLREHYRNIEGYGDIKTVYTIHNLKYQGVFPSSMLSDVLMIQDCPAAVHQLSFNGGINFMKGALLYSDRLTTVSESYAEEIKTEYFGENLHDIFRERHSVLTGILNGINQNAFDPRKDKHISTPYGLKNFELKAKNKLDLQARLGLEQNENIPLAVYVGRLTEQKGIDLINHITDTVINSGLQIAMLGTGELWYESALSHFAATYPGKYAVHSSFDAQLANVFYAGADMLLMPSKFEPCGLSQMMAMRYGTLPIVRSVGGLADSITPYDEHDPSKLADGFAFANYNAHELLSEIERAQGIYNTNRNLWVQLCKNAMRKDFSWNRSALRYMEIYRDLLGQ